jgi:hypothetical protein
MYRYDWFGIDFQTQGQALVGFRRLVVGQEPVRYVKNQFRITVWEKYGDVFGRTQERFDSGRALVNSDYHIRVQHLQFLKDLNAVCKKPA